MVDRDYEMAALREQLRRHEQVTASLYQAVTKRADISINGVIYRAA